MNNIKVSHNEYELNGVIFNDNFTNFISQTMETVQFVFCCFYNL